MEFHTYKSMATYCLSHHFMHSSCNHRVDYQKSIIKSRQIDKKIFRNILMTPLNVLSINLLQAECLRTAENELKPIYELSPSEQEVNLV